MELDILLIKTFYFRIFVQDITNSHKCIYFLVHHSNHRREKLRALKSSVPDPAWLTEDIKNVFKHEVHLLKNGLRLTKLVCVKKENH